jgi:putative acetyltransferase
VTRTAPQAYPVRPYLPGDAAALCELFAQSIDELCTEDYDEDQRLAWISGAADSRAFGGRLAAMTTLVVMVGTDYGGFAALKDNAVLDMLYVNPHYAGEGIGTTLADTLERLAAGRGAKDITVESSETAVMFFEARGYVANRRNMLPVGDQWLTNTTLTKKLGDSAKKDDVKS